MGRSRRGVAAGSTCTRPSGVGGPATPPLGAGQTEVGLVLVASAGLDSQQQIGQRRRAPPVERGRLIDAAP